MASLNVELDAYVLPDGHRVFKLFPGSTYRLAEALVASSAAFLDIRGLDVLGDDPTQWQSDRLREIVSYDRLLHNSTASKSRQRSFAQDARRIGFLRRLLTKAKEGDLLVVPLGKGLDAKVAIGEFTTKEGHVRKVNVEDGDNHYVTWARPVIWRSTSQRRRRFSNGLNKSLQAPAAFHLIERDFIEEIYLAAYGSFTYDDIYVASFPSSKERFTTTDQARIGIWFNALARIHDAGVEGVSLSATNDIYELGIEESGVELELIRNSPWTAIMRTAGPLAFSALAIFPMAVEAKPLSELQNATVSAKPVAGATDKCAVIIPKDMIEIAKGYGQGRWDAHCRLGKKVHEGATLSAKTHLKVSRKKHS